MLSSNLSEFCFKVFERRVYSHDKTRSKIVESSFVVKWQNTPAELNQMDWLIAIYSQRLKISMNDFNQQNPVDGTHFGRP